MKKPPVLKNEIERLKSLVEYYIMETPAEKDFDDLAQLASQICDTPIALISFIDGSRQWYKAKVGIDATETPREYTFCGHAIAANEVMIVNDATKDERFFDNPAVIGGPMIRFYAGAPLQSSSGHNIGTICIAGPEIRELSPVQEEFLKVLSKHVMTLVEYRKKVVSLGTTIKSFQEIIKDLDSSHTEILNEDKLESLCGLASGVAHEINNPLTIILFTANMLKKKLKNNDAAAVTAGLENIEKTIHKMAGVVQELVNLSDMPPENFANGKTLRESFSSAIASKDRR